jgi:methylation protein EvaC
MKTCPVCGSVVEPIIRFGDMPLANGFLQQEDFPSEYFFELAFGFCETCAMAQLIKNVPREKMFHSNYPFFTASSGRMAAHFQRMADEVAREWLPAGDSFVVEIGCNDGTLLQRMASLGIRHLGVEPSANVAALAQSKGVSTICRFFDLETAREISGRHGQADVVLATNCICHIQDLHSLADGLQILLKLSGVLIFEDPYLGDVIERVAYDQIYDEHAYYFSVLSLTHWFSGYGFEIVALQPQNVHGGSMRYTASRNGARQVKPEVPAQQRRELSLGLHLIETYRQFGRNVDRSSAELLRLLRRLKQDGKRVVGYAATSKSTTVLNYCGISTDLIEFVTDTTPAKQGRFSPGTHIPVYSPEKFRDRYPDYALLFAWNHAEEVINNEHGFRQAGGRWIRYVPKVEIFA